MYIMYWNQSLWSSRSSGTPGEPCAVNWNFTIEPYHCQIPAIYRFDQGIGLDLLIQLDTQKVREFYERYAPIQSSLTETEEEILEYTRPFPRFSLYALGLDGREYRLERGSSGCYFPWLGETKPALRQAVVSHGISLEEAWYLQRGFYRPSGNPSTASPCLSVRFQPTLTVLQPTSSLRLKLDEPCQCQWVHPQTGRQHTLVFRSPRMEQLSAPLRYLLYAPYHVEPPLEMGEKLLLRQIAPENTSDGPTGVILATDAENVFVSHPHPSPLSAVQVSVLGVLREIPGKNICLSHV